MLTTVRIYFLVLVIAAIVMFIFNAVPIIMFGIQPIGVDSFRRASFIDNFITLVKSIFEVGLFVFLAIKVLGLFGIDPHWSMFVLPVIFHLFYNGMRMGAARHGVWLWPVESSPTPEQMIPTRVEIEYSRILGSFVGYAISALVCFFIYRVLPSVEVTSPDIVQ